MNTRSRARAAAAQTSARPASTNNAYGVVASVSAITSTRSTSTSTASDGTTTAPRAADLARYRFNRTRQLMKTERKLVRSCEHVVLLNDKIRGLTKRYQRARADGFKSFRYNLRIRLAAVEGVRNMYYEYARDRAEEVAELRKELYDQNVQIVTGSEPDESEDEWEVVDDDEQLEDDDEGSEADDMETEEDDDDN